MNDPKNHVGLWLLLKLKLAEAQRGGPGVQTVIRLVERYCDACNRLGPVRRTAVNLDPEVLAAIPNATRAFTLLMDRVHTARFTNTNDVVEIETLAQVFLRRWSEEMSTQPTEVER